jgi:spermidine synthase
MSITISEKQGVRYLHFGSPWIQGAMRIARPYALVLEYTRDLMAPLLLRPGAWPASVLQVGLGAASITRFLHRHRPEAKLTVVEIDPSVVPVALDHFRLPDEGPNLRIVIGDAVDHVAAKERRHDLIVVDGFDSHGRPGMLDSEPFYVNCRSRLTRDGMLTVNLLTRTRGIKASVDRMRRAFDDRVLVLPPSEAGNTVAIAAVGHRIEESFESLRSAARKLREATGLDLASTLARIEQARGGDALKL